MAKPKFSFKIDWYTFKKQGIPSSAKLQPALEPSLITCYRCGCQPCRDDELCDLGYFGLSHHNKSDWDE